MENTTSQQTTSGTVIGKHAEAYAVKGQRTGAIAMIICAVLFAVFGIVVIATLEDVLTVAAVMFGVAALFAILGIVLFIKSNGIMKNCGTPAIIYNADNTLTLNISQNKQVTVNVAEIANVKFQPRVQAQYLGVVTRYTQQEDGNVKIYTASGAKYVVTNVDKGATVVELINSYKK